MALYISTPHFWPFPHPPLFILHLSILTLLLHSLHSEFRSGTPVNVLLFSRNGKLLLSGGKSLILTTCWHIFRWWPACSGVEYWWSQVLSNYSEFKVWPDNHPIMDPCRSAYGWEEYHCLCGYGDGVCVMPHKVSCEGKRACLLGLRLVTDIFAVIFIERICHNFSFFFQWPHWGSGVWSLELLPSYFQPFWQNWEVCSWKLW